MVSSLVLHSSVGRCVEFKGGHCPRTGLPEGLEVTRVGEECWEWELIAEYLARRILSPKIKFKTQHVPSLTTGHLEVLIPTFTSTL